MHDDLVQVKDVIVSVIFVQKTGKNNFTHNERTTYHLKSPEGLKNLKHVHHMST